MNSYYSSEKAVQIVVALLKKHNIQRIIVSPGSANDTFVFSVQSDPYFKLYSCVDERSAAYMACGMAAELGEPVAISCTGATASRNYLPALTEAFYRQLPIVAITATRPVSKVGHNIDQVLDRSVCPKDAIKYSVDLPIVKDDEDFWECEIKVNMALLELNHHGKGPVHINLPTTYSRDYSVKTLPEVRQIQRIMPTNTFPELKDKRIAVYVASHSDMDSELMTEIDLFCENYDSVVFCEHTSGYNGKYKVPFLIAASQKQGNFSEFVPDIEIELGEISAQFRMPAKEIWRVSEDGIIRDCQKKLTKVFEMPEVYFFDHYNKIADSSDKAMEYYNSCRQKLNSLWYQVSDELPFSNIWIAHKLSKVLPEESVVHFGILNSFRSWAYFDLPASIKSYCNIGGFGIDGGVSSLIGASLVNPDKLYFGFFGDLAFFYDMNSIGNRHIQNNLRIIVVNNGLGGEFKNPLSPASDFGDEANSFVSAEGHFGNKSESLLREYSKSLGFEYMFARNKAEFDANYARFVQSSKTERPILFEVFTNYEEENLALEFIMNIDHIRLNDVQHRVKNMLERKWEEARKAILK